jgi:hypothetical protein
MGMVFTALSARQQLKYISEKRCFLYGPYRDVIRGQVWSCSQSERVGGLCEMAASLGVSSME